MNRNKRYHFKPFYLLVIPSCLLVLSGCGEERVEKNPRDHSTVLHAQLTYPGSAQGEADLASSHSEAPEEMLVADRAEPERPEWLMPGRILRGKSVDQFKGRVKNIKRVPYPDGTKILMVVEADGRDLLVTLGPQRFINQSRVKIITGDKVVVQAYPVMVNGDMIFMASEVSKNGHTLKLRDGFRTPVWEKAFFVPGDSQYQRAPQFRNDADRAEDGVGEYGF